MTAKAIRTGVGWAVCWIARCEDCAWQHEGSSSSRRTAADWRDSHRCQLAHAAPEPEQETSDA